MNPTRPFPGTRPLSPCSALVAACLALVEVPDFSDDYRAPSRVELPEGASISGRWSGRDDYDLLAIGGLEGGQTLLLNFRPLTEQVGYSFSAGGQLFYQGTPFRHSAWEGRRFGSPSLRHGRADPQTFALTLPADFNAGGGQRAYLGLYGTHGALGYTIEVLDR